MRSATHLWLPRNSEVNLGYTRPHLKKKINNNVKITPRVMEPLAKNHNLVQMLETTLWEERIKS